MEHPHLLHFSRSHFHAHMSPPPWLLPSPLSGHSRLSETPHRQTLLRPWEARHLKSSTCHTFVYETSCSPGPCVTSNRHRKQKQAVELSPLSYAVRSTVFSPLPESRKTHEILDWCQYCYLPLKQNREETRISTSHHKPRVIMTALSQTLFTPYQ